MDEWAIPVYGDPCRACDFSWSLTVPEALATVRELPIRYSDVVATATGSERLPDLAWSVTAYVCHVADNLHIWAERLQGVIRGGGNVARAYDETRLADVRGYDGIGVPAALWSLTRSADDWSMTIGEAARWEGERRQALLLVHLERGELTLAEVARANAHDAVHHLWDIGRILAAQS